MAFARVAVLLAACSVAGYAQVRPDKMAERAQQLKTLSLAQLGDVEVTTQSKEPTEVWNTPAAIYVLSGEQIRRSGVTSVPDALRLVPGVNVERVNGSRNWAVGIRGLGDQYSKYVQVLIDGRSIYTPLFGGVLWTVENVMLEDIDRIEVIRGPGGTIWGANAVNGIINIITKSSQDTLGTVISAGGGNVDQNTEDLRYGVRKGKWNARVNALGFVRSPEYHIDGQTNYDWSRWGQVGFRTDRKGSRDEITIQGDAYWGKFGDAQAIATYSPPAEFISYRSTDVSGGNLLGRWRRNLGGKADLYLQAFWSHDHRIGSNFGEERETFDVDFLHRLPLGDRNQFTYGVGLRLSPSTIKQTIETINFIPAKKTDSIYSAFLQDEFRIVPEKLVFTLGSKLEHDTYTGFEYQPSGRLLFTPTPTRTIWGAISRAVRTPDRVDEDVQVDVYVPPVIWGRINGNHAIRSERLVAYEGGIRTLVVPRLYVSLSGFHNVYRDLLAQSAPTITPAPSPPFPPQNILVGFTYLNGVKGHTDGAEIAPELQASEWWRIRAAYSYLHIDLEDQNGFTNKVTLRSLRGSSPNSQAFLQSQINVFRNVEFDQTVRFVGALPAQSVRSYVTGDIRLGWQPSRAWSLSVAGENLFQAHHAEFNVNPGPMVLIKRSVYAKIVWTR